MLSTNIRPKWWQLYLTFPLLIALFVLETRLRVSVRAHQAVQIGILLLVYGLIHIWLKANRSALSQMDRDRYSKTLTVIRIPNAQLPDHDGDAQRRPMFEISVSEIKGVLSEGFDIRYIDAESLPIERVTQVLKKE
jgi:hypothetical protein